MVRRWRSAAWVAVVVGAIGFQGHALAQPPPTNTQTGYREGTPPSFSPYNTPTIEPAGGFSFIGSSLFPGEALSNKLGDCSQGAASVEGRPRVVNTYPARGAVVRPGLIVVRVSFDRPMSCDATFGFVKTFNPCPSLWQKVSLSRDRRSFRAVCKVEANQHYVLPLRSFRSGRNVLMAPYDVPFSTSGSSVVENVRQALAEDKDARTILGG